MGPWGVMTEASVIRIHHNFLSLASSTSLEILNPVHSFMLSVQELSIFLLHSTVCWWITLERVSCKYMCDWECACVIEGAHVWQSMCVVECTCVIECMCVIECTCVIKSTCVTEYICVIESVHVWLRVYIICMWVCVCSNCLITNLFIQHSYYVYCCMNSTQCTA